MSSLTVLYMFVGRCLHHIDFVDGTKRPCLDMNGHHYDWKGCHGLKQQNKTSKSFYCKANVLPRLDKTPEQRVYCMHHKEDVLNRMDPEELNDDERQFIQDIKDLNGKAKLDEPPHKTVVNR